MKKVKIKKSFFLYKYVQRNNIVVGGFEQVSRGCDAEMTGKRSNKSKNINVPVCGAEGTAPGEHRANRV